MKYYSVGLSILLMVLFISCRNGKQQMNLGEKEKTDSVFSQQSDLAENENEKGEWLIDGNFELPTNPLVANKGEISDGRIAVKKIKEVVYDKYYIDNNSEAYGFDLCDNPDNPSYKIRIISCLITQGLGYNMNIFFDEYEKSEKLETIPHSSKEDEYYLKDSTYCYTISRTYEAGAKHILDVTAVRSYKTNKLCVVICKREIGKTTPFGKIVKSIRFE